MKKILLTTLLLGITTQELSKDLEGTLSAYENINLKDKKEILYDSIPAVPKYKDLDKDCSKYIRLAGKKLFHKNYVWTPAWNRRYYDKLVYSFHENDPYIETKKLSEEKILKPGMVLGVYNPKSKYNHKKDLIGKTRKYTHVLLYVKIKKMN